MSNCTCDDRGCDEYCPEHNPRPGYKSLQEQLAAVTAERDEAQRQELTSLNVMRQAIAREAALHTVLTLTGLTVPDLSDGAAKLLGDLEAVTAERDELARLVANLEDYKRRAIAAYVGHREAEQAAIAEADEERDAAIAREAALREQIAGFPNVDGLRICMLETADENDALRKALAELVTLKRIKLANMTDHDDQAAIRYSDACEAMPAAWAAAFALFPE